MWLEQKQKYAAWKVADIRKALKEGRKPNPGPPNGDEDLSIPSSTPNAKILDNLNLCLSLQDLGPKEPAVTSPRQDSDLSPEFNDEVNNQRYIPPSVQFHDKIDMQHSSNISPASPSYPSARYPSLDQSYPQEPQQQFHPPPPTSRSENPIYPRSYHHQPYPQEPQLHLPHT
ncbi:hypothetical protein REPUB_Repub18cG0014200 [Reevesia pubescens]